MSTLRIKYQYRVIDQRAGQNQPPLMAVSIHHGVVRRDTLTDDLPRAEDLSNYKMCEPGDIVLNRMRAFQGAIGISPQRGLVSPDYIVLRPDPDVDSRYLHHLFRSTWFVGEMVSRLRGIGNTENGAVRTPRINPEDFGNIPVVFPPIDEQRRIADFLDAETARIDRLQYAHDRQLAVLAELALSRVSAVVPSKSEVAFVRLGYLAAIQSGITVDGNRDFGTDAVTMPYLRVANVQNGHVDLSSVSEITIPRSAAQSATLKRGDVLMTEGGDLDKLGRGTVWLEEIKNCLHQNHVFAVRSDQRMLVPEYLALLTRTAYARSYFESTGTKTTNLASTSSSKIRDFKVPLLDVADQARISQDIDARLKDIGRLEAALNQQRFLLAERRQALITAAVTGQMDVTTARGLGPAGGTAI